jgi:hypothetical protein
MPSPTGRSPASTAEARGRRLGSLIGGIFGLIYVEANVGSLPDLWATALQIAAAVAFAGLVAVLALARGPRAPAGSAAGVGFGSRYWLVVAGEVAAIPAGAAILRPAGAWPRRGGVGVGRGRRALRGARRHLAAPAIPPPWRCDCSLRSSRAHRRRRRRPDRSDCWGGGRATWDAASRRWLLGSRRRPQRAHPDASTVR